MDDDNKNTEINNGPNKKAPPSLDSAVPTQITQPNAERTPSQTLKKSYRKILLVPVIIITAALLTSGVALATIVLLKNNLQTTTKTRLHDDKVRYIENEDGEIIRVEPGLDPTKDGKGESESKPIAEQNSDSDTDPTQTKKPAKKPDYSPPEKTTLSTTAKPNQQSLSDIATGKTPTPGQPSAQPSTSPKETWLKSRAELDKAKTLAELMAYMFKNYSKELLADISEIEEELKSVPKELEGWFIDEIRGPLSSEVTSVKETINGDTATLNVETKSKGISNMVVIMVLENGQWKIGSEDWD